MAGLNISQEWQEVKREHKVARFSPTISLRSNGAIGISIDFIKMARIESCTHASLFLSLDGSKLAIKFHNQKIDNAYLLGKDGGNSGKYQNRLIVATALINQSKFFKSLLKENMDRRVFEPIKDGDKWVITLNRID